jgi:hypothetical protein
VSRRGAFFLLLLAAVMVLALTGQLDVLLERAR